MNLSKRSLICGVSALALLVIVCFALALIWGRGPSILSLHNPFGVSSRARTGESLYLQDSSRVHYGAARVHFLGGRYSEAEEELRHAIAADPDNPEPHQLLAQVILRRFQSSPSGALLATAIASQQRAVTLGPGQPSSHYNLGILLMHAGRSSEAEGEYKSALTADSTFLPAYRELGNLHRRQGRFDAARTVYERGLLIDPDNPDLLYGLGTVFEHSGLLHEAIGVYRRAAEIDSSLAEVHLNLGRLLIRLGNRKEGEAEIARFERSHEDDIAGLATRTEAKPNDSALLLRLAAAQARSRHFAASEVAYRRVMALSPRSVEPVADLVAVYRESGQEAKAESLLAMAYRRFPGHPLLSEQQALLALQRRQYADAVRLFSDLAGRFPDRGDLFLLLGRAEAMSGDLQTALRHVQRARALLPDRRDLLVDLSELCLRLGKWTEAVTTAEEATRLNPRSSKAYAVLGAAYAASGRSSDAALASRRAKLLRQSTAYSVDE